MKLELIVSVDVDLEQLNARLTEPTRSANYLIDLATKHVHKLLSDPACSGISVSLPERH